MYLFLSKIAPSSYSLIPKQKRMQKFAVKIFEGKNRFSRSWLKKAG
jgi:hypothetical protein